MSFHGVSNPVKFTGTPAQHLVSNPAIFTGLAPLHIVSAPAQFVAPQTWFMQRVGSTLIPVQPAICLSGTLVMLGPDV